jgi:hypothetical protein
MRLNYNIKFKLFFQIFTFFLCLFDIIVKPGILRLTRNPLCYFYKIYYKKSFAKIIVLIDCSKILSKIFFPQ